MTHFDDEQVGGAPVGDDATAAPVPETSPEAPAEVPTPETAPEAPAAAPAENA